MVGMVSLKVVKIHPNVMREIRDLEPETYDELQDLLDLLEIGARLQMPVSRPMPIVAHGAFEIRLRDRTGQYRLFYFTKDEDAILVFHCFKKKTEQTPDYEIETARRRLREMRK